MVNLLFWLAYLCKERRCRMMFLLGLMVGTPVIAADRIVRCHDCHLDQAESFHNSVHRHVLTCRDCHGGASRYDVPASRPTDTQPAGPFDHGASFRGSPARKDIPTHCGTCHAEVDRMNPYGFPTDQLARYRVSGHGKRLQQTGDDRVAVCTDCHGTHDTLASDNRKSRTHFSNVTDTCGRCHADAALMKIYNHPPELVEQYRISVHGRNVLEGSDAGSPTCATCHGAHGAAPPGVSEVGFVCGRCHEQVADYFLTSVHGRMPGFPRCIGCHAPEGDWRHHQIKPVSVHGEQLVDAFLKSSERRERFVDEVHALGGTPRYEDICLRCHGSERASAHAPFFTESDDRARTLSQAMATELRDAQFVYARTAARVARVGRGELLVSDEALLAEDARTEVKALSVFAHTLDIAKVRERAEVVKRMCREIDAALDAKEADVASRRVAIAPVWGAVALFLLLLYLRFAKWSETGESHPTRRRVLVGALRLTGAAFVAALAWPVSRYIRPVGKRGQGRQIVSAGQEADWSVWDARTVMIGRDPVAVIHTQQGYQAVSARCTHLGCVVRWDGAKRQLLCPCHGGRFDAGGKVLAGPVPAPLPAYDVAVVDGEVMVSAAAKT